MRKRGTSALQAQARLMVIRGNPSVAQPATAGIQTSKPLSTILMMYLRHCCDYHAPAVAYHSWYLTVRTAPSPRMAVLCPLMQINRQQRAIEDMTDPEVVATALCLRRAHDPGCRYRYQSFTTRHEFRLARRQQSFSYWGGVRTVRVNYRQRSSSRPSTNKHSR